MQIRLMLVLLLAVWAGQACLVRLYRLQVDDGAIYRQRAQQNTLEDELTPAPRGRIDDRHGRVLVRNQPQYALILRAAEVRNLPSALHALASALRRPAAVLSKRVRHRLQLDPGDPVVVAHALTAGQLARVVEMLPQVRGVTLETRPQRVYPHGGLASHELGFVGDISDTQYQALRRRGYHAFDIIGQSGLEESYEKYLHGRPGVEEVAVDAMGRSVALQARQLAVPGDDLILSLDEDLQAHTEKVLGQALERLYQQNGERTAGTIVMLEAQTGRVLAMASLPNFNPERFAQGITGSAYQALMTNPLHPLLSRAFQSAWPTGSTFKPLEACACLQCGICTPTSQFYCTGEYRGFHCFVRSGHGHLDFTEAIAQSCDATFYMLGDHLGITRMDRFAHAFGLGHRTGLDLPDEDDGLYGTPAWKKRVYHEDWQWYDTINMAIGQGLMMATPLQMAVAVAAIANGGRIYRPHLVDRVLTWNHRLVWRYRPRPVRRLPVKAQYLAAVRHAMAMVVDHGTGTAARSPIISIAGKTGTAEAVPTVDNPQGRNHTWFVSFAPVDHPKVVTVVMLAKSGGYGGGEAAPLARDRIEYWAHHGMP